MAVTMYCPNLCCPTVLSTSEIHRGQIVESAECGARFRVPPRRSRRLAANPPASAEAVIEIVFQPLSDDTAVADMPPPPRLPTDFPVSTRRGLPTS